jgi:hypothetical protein
MARAEGTFCVGEARPWGAAGDAVRGGRIARAEDNMTVGVTRCESISKGFCLGRSSVRYLALLRRESRSKGFCLGRSSIRYLASTSAAFAEPQGRDAGEALGLLRCESRSKGYCPLGLLRCESRSKGFYLGRS